MLDRFVTGFTWFLLKIKTDRMELNLKLIRLAGIVSGSKQKVSTTGKYVS